MSNVVEATGRSMLAGCLQSVSFVRGLLYDLVKDMCEVLHRSITAQESKCEEFVDDLSQVVASKSQQEVIDAGIRIGRIMQQGSAALHLDISDR